MTTPESNSLVAAALPLVSVIVPVYNRASQVRACVQSVLNQSYRPLELIVVDDGSTDDTWTVVSEMAAEFSDLESFAFRAFRQINHGAPAARNHGVTESEGQWVQFLDSDDELLSDKISEGVRLAQKQSADIVYCKAQHVTETGDRLERYWGRDLSRDWRDFFEFSWQTMCALYSRAAIDKIGRWNQTLVISQDWEFCIRAVASGLSIHFDDSVRALYCCEGDDRIGSGISLVKHRGRERALWAVWELLERKQLIVPELKTRFLSRLLHVFLCYCSLSDRDSRIALCDRMRSAKLVGLRTAGAMKVFPPRWLAQLMLRRFQSPVR